MEHRQLIESFYDDGGPVAETSTLERVFHSDYVSHTQPGALPGVATALAPRGFIQASFSDVQYRLMNCAVDGDLAAIHVSFSAPHSGDTLGFPATNRAFTAEQMHFVRFAHDGRVVEHWGVRDDAGMIRQIKGGEPGS